MQTYTDKAGTVHRVDITLGTRRQIKAQYGLDLLAAAGDPQALQEFLSRVTADDDFLFGCLAIAEDTTVELLLANADGTTLENAATAFVHAVIDFFPSSSLMREPIRLMMARAEEHRAKMAELVQAGMMTAVGQLDLNTVLSESETPRNGSGELRPSVESGSTTQSG